MTPTSFAETLEKKLMERANYNKDLIEEKNRIQGELLSAPGMLRNELRSTAIRDPLARESILGDRLGNIRSGLGTVTDLLNMRGQRYSDIINRASGQYADEYAASQARGSGGGYGDLQAFVDKYMEDRFGTGDDETTTNNNVAGPDLVIDTGAGPSKQRLTPFNELIRGDYNALRSEGRGKLSSALVTALGRLPEYWGTVFGRRTFN